MAWTEEARGKLASKLKALWPTYSEDQIEATVNAVGNWAPDTIHGAMERLYSKQEILRRPSVQEILNEARGGVSGMTGRQAATSEIAETEKRLDQEVFIEIKGQRWTVSGAGIHRPGGWGVPMGKLTDSEVRRCLEAVRAADRSPEQLYSPEQIAADDQFWEERYNAADTEQKHI